MGSVPLHSDVKTLKDNDVVGVINMCAEYGGPKSAYKVYINILIMIVIYYNALFTTMYT